jgi:hypothetical protein
MIQELETVVLTHDIADHKLKEADVGTVVHCYDDGEAFEVEFVTAEGKTVAVLTLGCEEIRAMNSSEILHARVLAPS